MRSQNSGASSTLNMNGSMKMNNKIHSAIDKKTIGTASMRQRPTQQGGINQFGVNQSATLQSMRPFLTPDSTQLAQYQSNNFFGNQSIQLQQSPQSAINHSSLSFLVKPGFHLTNQSSSQNNRITNNSCMNIPTTSLINSMMNDNLSQTNLIDISQIHNHNKQQSIGSSNNLSHQVHPQPQNLNIFQQFKNNYFKQPTTPQVNSGSTNQEKRFSEQLHSENSLKMLQFAQQQHQHELQNQQSPQLSLIQTLTQKTLAPHQSSTRLNQKMRKTNSMSMIRLRQSQDSFFDTILNGESHSNQGRSMVQAKKKKKGKKFGVGGGGAVSPNSSSSTAAAALSQLISSQTNRMKSIPSPQPIHLAHKIDTQKQYQTSSSSQNDFSPQFFSKLKKKKMLLYQTNSKVLPSKIDSSQNLKKSQQQQQQQIMQQQPQIQHVHSSYDNSPDYQLWLIQQTQSQQVQNSNQPVSSPTLKNTASTLSQQSLNSGCQQSFQQLPSQTMNTMISYSLENHTNSSTLKKGSGTSKTHSLLDKLNKLHKYSQQNLNANSPSTYNHSQENVAPNQQQQIQEQFTEQKKQMKEKKQSQERLDIPIIEEDNSKSLTIFKKFQDLLGEQSCKNSSKSQQSPKVFSDQKSLFDQSQSDYIVEKDVNKSQFLTQKLIQNSQKLHDIPLPSQTLKNNQYDQYENILEDYKKSNTQNNENLKEFMDYLISFAKKYIKPIPQIVKNSQQISLQYKKKDEEVTKLKQEKLTLLVEKNKQNQTYQEKQGNQLSNEKSMPEFIQIQHSLQQLQQQTLKELHTPSTQIEETNQQGLIVDQQAQIQLLKKQLDDKNNQINHLVERENITIAYLQQLQKLGYLPASSSQCSDSSDRNRNGNASNQDDKKSGGDLSSNNTPHSINPLDNSCMRSSNPLSSSLQQQNQQSSEKEYQFNALAPSSDNDKESFLQQYQQLYSRLQKVVPFQSQNRENFLSEQSISVRQNKEKASQQQQQQQQQQEINQSFNQWLKFISNKKKNNHYLQKSSFNNMNSAKNSLMHSCCTTLNNNTNITNNLNSLTQNNLINPDFSLNLDHSHLNHMCNSTSGRNSLTKNQIKGQINPENQVQIDMSEDRKVKDKTINVVKLLEKAQQLKQNNQLSAQQGISSENTPNSQVDTAFQNKSTQGNINQTTSLSNDVEITSFQYLKNTPLISAEGSNQVPLEEYKKKNSKLSSVSSSARNSFTSKSSYMDDELNKMDIQNQIATAQLELQQRYNQTMIVKSKSSSSLNDNIRQKLKLDLSVLKSPASTTNQLNQTKGLGLQLNLGLLNDKHQVNQNNDPPEQNQVMDYYDEFMSKIDEFSLSWRKAVIDESQKYQNRDNPFKKQQLMDQQKQIQQNNINNNN